MQFMSGSIILVNYYLLSEFLKGRKEIPFASYIIRQSRAATAIQQEELQETVMFL